MLVVQPVRATIANPRVVIVMAFVLVNILLTLCSIGWGRKAGYLIDVSFHHAKSLSQTIFVDICREDWRHSLIGVSVSVMDVLSVDDIYLLSHLMRHHIGDDATWPHGYLATASEHCMAMWVWPCTPMKIAVDQPGEG